LQAIAAAAGDCLPDWKRGLELRLLGLVQPDPLKPSGDEPFPGFKYVQDVHPSDPPRWILAHQPMTVGPMRAVSLIYANGHRDVLEASVFEQALAAFRKEYEAARGSPPQVLPAEDKP
jgi:hypothetical protein